MSEQPVFRQLAEDVIKSESLNEFLGLLALTENYQRDGPFGLVPISALGVTYHP
jgi:hypothetical protein